MTGREEARDGFADALDAWRIERDSKLIPLALAINNGAEFVAAREVGRRPRRSMRRRPTSRS